MDNQNNTNQSNENDKNQNGNNQYNNNQNSNNQYGNNGYYNNGNGPRRLTKSRDHMITGVCGGIAEYLNADVTVIRIVTILFAFSGAGLIAYIVAAIIMPEK